MTTDDTHASAGLPTLAFGTLGIVYGDIGTSPIYAFRGGDIGVRGLRPPHHDRDPRRAVLRAAARHGAHRPRVFSPVMIVWFTVIGTLGLRQIIRHPSVVRAISAS